MEPNPEIDNPTVSSKPPAASQDADGVFEYIGPFSAAVKRVKVDEDAIQSPAMLSFFFVAQAAD